MRQIFSSARLENVESVARLLNGAGIETWISGGRSYKGNRRSRHSYAESERIEHPGVWVVRAEDQPRARELLRGAGLLDAGRSQSMPGALPLPTIQRPEPSRWARRLRIGLFLLLIPATAFTVLRGCGPRPAPTPPAQPPQPPTEQIIPIELVGLRAPMPQPA